MNSKVLAYSIAALTAATLALPAAAQTAPMDPAKCSAKMMRKCEPMAHKHHVRHRKPHATPTAKCAPKRAPKCAPKCAPKS